MSSGSVSGTSRAEQIVKLAGLEVRSDRHGAVHTIGLAGEIDIANADRIVEELVRVEASDAEAIVLDLSQVTFLDSTAVRLLLEAEYRSRENGSRLSLVRPPDRVMRVLTISGVDDMLPFAD